MHNTCKYLCLIPATDDVSSTAKSQPNIYIETPSLCWEQSQPLRRQPDHQSKLVPLPAPRNVTKQVCTYVK